MRPMGWIVIVVLAMALAACGTSEPVAECDSNQDCTGDPGAGCEWMCIDNNCEKVCPQQCQDDADCEDLPWTSQCTGHWECIGNECEPVCDPVACTEVADCLDLTWPLQCPGHWECQNGKCVPVCDSQPDCREPVDCVDLTWDIRCVGHWACEQGECVEVCDDVGCGNGICDTLGGESAQSCPLDCTTACVEEGFPTGIPPACCSGLDALSDCVPDRPCPGSLLFCVDCGDRTCDPHENPYNCLEDCLEGCPVGEERSYQCPNGPEVDWCVCQPPECRPVCLYLGTRSEGWYDSCTEERFDWAFCSDNDVAHQAVCRHIATESEGWYDEATGELILWDYCASLWECIIDPKAQCR